eukprot:12919104-Prorocentrum_lima.AAC.1
MVARSHVRQGSGSAVRVPQFAACRFLLSLQPTGPLRFGRVGGVAAFAGVGSPGEGVAGLR